MSRRLKLRHATHCVALGPVQPPMHSSEQAVQTALRLGKCVDGQLETHTPLRDTDAHDTHCDASGPVQPALEHCDEHARHCRVAVTAYSVLPLQDATQLLSRRKLRQVEPLTTAGWHCDGPGPKHDTHSASHATHVRVASAYIVESHRDTHTLRCEKKRQLTHASAPAPEHPCESHWLEQGTHVPLLAKCDAGHEARQVPSSDT